ncbi:MAG: outer membrane lipid asymmetry maintenance protein MlaD [Paracoccaceae bacterium]|nr:outer membrane lipid asymmetry maintenance protein MlaD [Paracoccaceae bacterium]MDE3237656.1 outer membrane lipid asymmetry maintenance protein MlaD [Paracoccaceae bacterium]
MAENAAEVVVGGLVIAAAAGFVLFAAQATGFAKRSGGTYPLVASFRSIEGINVGTDVKLAGVKIGTISNIALNPKTYFADATIQVKDGVALPTDSAILISQDGLLGGSYVEVVPGGAPDNLKPGERITDTQGAVSLITLLMKFVGGQSGSGGSAASGANGAAKP